MKRLVLSRHYLDGRSMDQELDRCLWVIRPSLVLHTPEAQQPRRTKAIESGSSRAFWIPDHFKLGYRPWFPELF
jgi:hypothetical protein